MDILFTNATILPMTAAGDEPKTFMGAVGVAGNRIALVTASGSEADAFRTCSSRMMESRFRPQLSFTGRAIWVGRRALPVCEVIAAAMTVGLYRLPVSF